MQQSTMQPKPETLVRVTAGRRRSWHVAAGLALGLVGLCALFFREGRSAVEIWNVSTAYGHCYLILPMTLYLLWERRAAIAAAPLRPELGWSLLAVPTAAAWLVAERLGIMEGRQLMAIAAAQVLFLALLGWRTYWRLSGPLLYLFFLVPFGAFLTPALQRFTADFSIVGLNLLGIPNYADNFVIETPAGVFFVAEACAGLRFLIAAIAFGVFYALLNFQSPGRRAAFIVASFVVPVVANGFRALGIVVLGQVLGSAEAAAADHVIYGWVFFSIVMLLLVAAGQPFRQAQPVRSAGAAVPGPVSVGWRPVLAAVLVGALAAVGPAIAAAIDSHAASAQLAAAPEWSVPPGCRPPVPIPPSSASTSRAEIVCGDRAFEVQVTAFPARSTSAAMVVERRRVTAELGAEDVSITSLDSVKADGGRWTIVQTTDPDRLTASAAWIDGAPVQSGMAGRLAQARDSLLGASHAPVLVTITTGEPARATAQWRRATLEQLRALIDAQDHLDGQIARLSRLP